MTRSRFSGGQKADEVKRARADQASQATARRPLLVGHRWLTYPTTLQLEVSWWLLARRGATEQMQRTWRRGEESVDVPGKE